MKLGNNTGEEKGALLPRLSVTRPVTVAMVVAALIVLGVIALGRLPLQLMPAGYESSFMMVRVPYPNANPREVEEEIIRPLEDALFTVRGIQELNCRAASDAGRCWVEFAEHVEMSEVYNEVADRVERLRATEWPDDIEFVRLRRFDPNSQPVQMIGVYVPASLDDPYWYLTRHVVQQLERLPGVAQVDLEGVYERQIFVEPRRESLESFRLSIFDLSRALRRASFALSSGDLDEAGQRLIVRSVARFESLESIREVPVRDDGLRLGDVATVRYGTPAMRRISRLDGRDAAMVEVFKESEANTIEVTESVREELARIFAQEDLLGGEGAFSVLFDQGETIKDSLTQLRDTGVLGGLLAIVILYMFMRRVRVTLLITLAIPTSLLTCLVVMFFAGESINLITMMGLIICTGMLVDNAVVVVENIDRCRREGLEVGRAALAGASEIALALTMATVTTIGVFVPVALLGGQGMMRFMFGKMALPIVVSIAASLVVALLFIPLAASLVLRSEAERQNVRRGPVTRAADALYRVALDPLHRLYLFSLRWALRYRGVPIVVVLATIVLTFYVPFQETEVSIQGRGHRGGRQVRFFFRLPNSYGMQQANAWFREVETIFLGAREEMALRHVQTRFWQNRGQVRCLLKGTDETDMTVEQAVSGLRALVPERPGVKVFANWERSGGGEASMTVQLYGEDTPTLATIAEEAERRLRTIPGLVSVEPDLENALEEVQIRVGRERALRYGVAPERIAGNVSASLRGQRLPRFRKDEKEIEVTVQLPEHERRGVGKLGALPLGGKDGRPIPLEAMAEIKIQRGFGDIHRRNRRTSLGIKLNTTWDSLEELRPQVAGVMDGLGLPRGYSWDYGSSFRFQQQDNRSMLLGLALAIVFIYLIMGFLFESSLLPLSVMPSIVLSWVGVYWLLWATGAKLDMMAAIGLILLAGVVVNNGIVLIDHVNALRRRGTPREQALVEGCGDRLRPVLMTAMTTIFGLMPLAFSAFTVARVYIDSLAVAVIGGLTSSTLFTLIALPVWVCTIEDLGKLGVRFLARRPWWRTTEA